MRGTLRPRSRASRRRPETSLPCYDACMRTSIVFALVGLGIIACRNAPGSNAIGHAEGGGPNTGAEPLSIPSASTTSVATPSSPKATPVLGAGLCNPSSVAQGTTCPTRPIPPGTGNSPEGCKSDAECTQGRDGRCVRAWGDGAENDIAPSEARRTNLLAGPPRPPPRSKCVYDECMTDKDCGAGTRCMCGSGKGKDRNECIRTDACLSDADCGIDKLCLCGQGARANTCVPGNCRADSDCAGSYRCETYCRSAKDACHDNSECKAPEHMIAICMYLEETHAWGCKNMVPRPPG